MEIRDACEADLAGILAIYNDAVLTTTAIWNETVADLASRRAWLDERRSQGYPVLVATDGAQVMGYASFGDFRAWHGYRYTVEHSVYVSRDHRRRGVGAALLACLIERARAQGKHVMVGGIEAGNEASLRLHARKGFQVVGHLAQVGTKLGRWLDLVLVQYTLSDSAAPGS